MGYQGSVLSTQLKVSGVEVFSAGDLMEGEGKEAIKVFDGNDGIYKKIVIQDNKIVGAVLFGDSSDGNRLFSMIQKQAESPLQQRYHFCSLSSDDFGGSLVASMSEEEIICGCNGVSKGAIIQAIQNTRMFIH